MTLTKKSSNNSNPVRYVSATVKKQRYLQPFRICYNSDEIEHYEWQHALVIFQDPIKNEIVQ